MIMWVPMCSFLFSSSRSTISTAGCWLGGVIAVNHLSLVVPKYSYATLAPQCKIESDSSEGTWYDGCPMRTHGSL